MKALTFRLDCLEGNPASVNLGRISAWVIRDEAGSVKAVLENRCAHMGSKLRCTKSGFHCDSHNWSYDSQGVNTVSSNPSLNRLDYITDGETVQIFIQEDTKILSDPSEELDGSEYLELISHATFLLDTEECNVLFDPWIKGDTYWGAWTLFPKNDFDFRRLKEVDCVVITHPHPDHFHPETLELLARDTKIIMPAFPSQIIPRVLRNLGFTNFEEVEWEVEVELSKKIKLAFLRPNSFWEDSSVLVRVADFTWVNQNDAGAPINNYKIPEGISLLTSSFDVGASGYPLTWQMSEERQRQIILNSKKQILETIRTRCSDLNASNFAPFAGYWRHGMAEHADYARELVHTTFIDLEKALDTVSTNLIPTLPSSKINLKSLKHEYDTSVLRELDENRIPQANSQLQSRNEEFKPERLSEALRLHLAELKEMSLATNCELVEFTVKVENTTVAVREIFGAPDTKQAIKIEASIAPETAALVISGDPTVTWNHLDIAYLVKWKRTPDTYPVNFMRLLQLGYVSALASKSLDMGERDILAEPIANLIEKNPGMARIILNRAGLPCASCHMSNKETLAEAIDFHRVGVNQRQTLIGEVKALLV